MTMLPPRLGLNDLLYLNRAHLVASSEDTDHPVFLLANRKLGSYWSPTAAAAIAGAVTVDLFPVEGQQIPVNWLMSSWGDGYAAPPDGWSQSGAGGTVARDTTAAKTKAGPCSAAVTRAGTDTCLSQAVLDATKWRGKRLSVGVHAWASVASRGYVAIYDGTTRWTCATPHSGGSSLEWIWATSGRIAAAATSITIELWVKHGNTTVYFSAPLICEGSDAAPVATPHPMSCDYVAFAGHTLGVDGVAVTVLSSADNFATTTTRLGAFTPTVVTGVDGSRRDRDTFRRFTPATAPAWRLSFSGGPFSPAWQVQVASLGLSRAMPRGMTVGFDPRSTETQGSTSRSAKGAPLGRLNRQALAKLRLGQAVLTEMQLDALEDLRQHAVVDAQPFWMAWDLGEHQNDAAFVWAVDNARWSAPLERLADGLGTRRWELDLEAVTR